MTTKRYLKAKNKKLKENLRAANSYATNLLAENDLLAHRLYVAEEKTYALIMDINALADELEAEEPEDTGALRVLDAAIERINAKLDAEEVVCENAEDNGIYAEFLEGIDPAEAVYLVCDETPAIDTATQEAFEAAKREAAGNYNI